MKKFTLESVRVLDLSLVLDSIPTRELPSIKEIRIVNLTVDDLNALIKPLKEAFDVLTNKKNEAIKPYREAYAEKVKEDLSKEDLAAFAKQGDEKFTLENDFSADNEKIKELGKVEVEVELSDEKLGVVKTFFTKYGPQFISDKKIIITICDALGID